MQYALTSYEIFINIKLFISNTNTYTGSTNSSIKNTYYHWLYEHSIKYKYYVHDLSTFILNRYLKGNVMYITQRFS